MISTDSTSTDRTAVASGTHRPAPGAVALRALLWVVLVIGAVGNAAVSFVGAQTPLPHIVFGGISALALVALVVVFRRARR
jgi:hypothetical protein